MDKLKSKSDEQGQQKAQVAQEAMQLQKLAAQADIENKQADTALKVAKTETERFNAQVGADKAFLQALGPAAGVSGAPYGQTQEPAAAGYPGDYGSPP
jgi:hypothetical protein